MVDRAVPTLREIRSMYAPGWRFEMIPMVALAAMLWGVSDLRAADLVGHRAVYDIALASAADGSGIQGAGGAVLYQFQETCDGWITENRTVLGIQFEGKAASETVWTYTSWESKDGHRFRFRTRDVRDGDTVENLRGTVVMAEGGGDSIAEFTGSVTKAIMLPRGTVFPVGHLTGLLEAAREGRTRAMDVVFDGSSMESPYEVSTVMQSVPQEEANPMAMTHGLPPLPVWRMRLAFFPVGAPTALPTFEMGVRYRQDGIADDLFQDFGDFALDLALKEIELLPRPDC
jgi:hypothetical protein